MIRTIAFFGITCGLALVVATPVQASEDNFKKAGCVACHTPDKKLVGPSLKDIAAKYKGQADAVAKLSEKVRKGGSGVWGPIPMPPNGADKISDADLKSTVEWILNR
ncbi:MAG: c-type cytochrome [Rhodocyclaceae bacterium]|nr:c-type cytochrome [Rhodocyclaceae bacterium]